MRQPDSATTREQVADTMIGLTRLSSSHRVIVAGSDSLHLGHVAVAVEHKITAGIERTARALLERTAQHRRKD